MGNRRKPRLRKVVSQKALDEKRLHIPMKEQTVVKEVPALIHWGLVGTVDRQDTETIGKSIIYEDGTQDLIIFSEISEEAKKLLYGINSQLDHLSLED